MEKNDKLNLDFLREQGIVSICGEINAAMAQSVCLEMLYLANKYPDRPIKVYINSPGGEVDAGFAIYDTINHIKPEVHTIGMGMVASMAAFLLSSGTKGKRYALPNARVLIHQPLGGVQGQASDILIAAEGIREVRDRLNAILAKNTGKPLARIEKDTDRDNVMLAKEALEYGLIDAVIPSESKAYKEDKRK